jgi:SAM-dependent methyltransferase
LLRVHDTAAANAIASVELYDLLRSRFRVDFIASDLHTELLFVDAGNTGWRVAMLPDGEWCQARKGKLIVNRYTWAKWRLFLNTLLGRYVETVVIPLAGKAFREGRIARRITLFHPKARRLAASHGDFHLEAADITNLPRGRFDIVRAMIVGLPGWDQPLRSRALQSLCGSLREGGLLVIGAADFSASVFVRSGGRMMHLLSDGADTPLRPEIQALQMPFGDVNAGAAEEATI